MSDNPSEATFLGALYTKYCDDGTVDAVELQQDVGPNRFTEYVGFEQLMGQLKNVTNLQFVNLSNMSIRSCGSADHDQFSLSKVQSMDLSFNALSCWKTVAQIVKFTQFLSELVLTSNPLEPLSLQDVDEIGQTFHCLNSIVLGSLSYSWDDICRCSMLWPNIKGLNLFNNKITHLSPIEDILQSVTFLSLSNNPLTDWREVCKLGTLLRLETLELANCHIASISFDNELPDSKSKTSLFPQLKYLDLTNNQINDWRSVAQLNRLAKLNCLLLKKNPLYDSNKYYLNFNYVISRIATIKTLDREPVTKEMRNDGEKYYLRTIYPEYLQKSDPLLKKQFLEENPCFLDLIDKFGEPVVTKKLSKEDKIKQNFLVLNINDEHNSDASKRVFQKQVPISTKVSNLKFILRRLLKIGMSQDFDLIVSSKDYQEEMQERNDINMYRFDADHTIHVRRI